MRNRKIMGAAVAALFAAGVALSCGGDGGTGPGGVASITVAAAPQQMYIGGTVELTATPKDANGNEVTGQTISWVSSNNAVASVNSSGLVRALSEGGPVTFTASAGGQSATTTTTVLRGVANPNCTIANATPITVGPPVTGNLTTNDCVNPEEQLFDYWVFTLATTTTVQMDMSSALFDTYLILLTNTLQLITFDDDNGPGTNSLITRQLAPGTYILQARGFDADDVGPYQIRIQAIGQGQ